MHLVFRDQKWSDNNGKRREFGRWGQNKLAVCGIEAAVSPFFPKRNLLPTCLRYVTTYVWKYLMICVEANYLPGWLRIHTWVDAEGTRQNQADVWTYFYIWHNQAYQNIW